MILPIVSIFCDYGNVSLAKVNEIKENRSIFTQLKESSSEYALQVLDMYLILFIFYDPSVSFKLNTTISSEL